MPMLPTRPSRLVKALLLATLASPAAFPGRAAAQGADADGQMSPADTARFAKLLKDVVASTGGLSDVKSREARRRFADAVERWQKDNAGADMLRMGASWAKMRDSVFDWVASPTGKGYITESVMVPWEHEKAKSRDVQTEYAYRLPKAYTPARSWPLILSLHDKGVQPDRHIKELWDGHRELADQFIIVTPADTGKSKGKDPVRYEWMEPNHIFTLLLPIMAVSETFNIDPNRIYLEGTGEGAATAFQLATLRSWSFAALVLRQGAPRRTAFAANLALLPTLVLAREGSEAAASEAVKDLDAKRSEYGFRKLTISTVPAAGAPKGQDTLKDANADVAAFLKDAVRETDPPAFRFATVDPIHRAAYWARLLKFDVVDGAVASIDVKCDRARNRIDVTCGNVGQFRLLLNDAIVDLDRPLEVHVNGQLAASRQLKRSLDETIAWIRANRTDRARLYCATIDVSVPEAPAPGEPSAESSPGRSGEGDK